MLGTESAKLRKRLNEQKSGHYYNKAAKDLPPPVEGDEWCMKHIVLGKAAGTKVSLARGLMKDEMIS